MRPGSRGHPFIGDLPDEPALRRDGLDLVVVELGHDLRVEVLIDAVSLGRNVDPGAICPGGLVATAEPAALCRPQSGVG